MPKDILLFELTTQEDEGPAIYIVGNFNDWQTTDERYKLKKGSTGKYQLRVSKKDNWPTVIEYKYVRGDWKNVELDEYGNITPNRQLTSDQQKVEDDVPRWKKNGLIFNPEFLPEIRIISDSFKIPQLIKTRRISALLPHDYSRSDERYPVLYLQDGQNLFDDYAPFGNWGVDKKLAILAERHQLKAIVIAIDHAEEERIEEFTPSTSSRFEKGEGKKYVRFLADTLKPYIDEHFRTLRGRPFTGIGGSSMGGLISIYASLMYPEVYGNLMVFSPSLWAAPNIHFHAINLNAASDVRIYLYAGEDESANMIPNIKKFKSAIEKQGSNANIDFKLSIDPKGKHNEARWGEEFPKALVWLFSKLPIN